MSIRGPAARLAALSVMVLAPRPPAQAQAAAVTGATAEHVVRSTAYGSDRGVWVHTPAGYPASCGGGCSLVVAFDGGEYLETIPLPTILDSLTADGVLPPTIALLIANGSGAQRIADLGNRARFARFVGDELIPWLRDGWRVTSDPARTIVTGSSAGGLAAAYLAYRRPDLFGNVLSQSGAFWRGNEASNASPYEWLTAQYGARARIPVRFLLEVGSTEFHGALGGAAPSILDANRHLRDMLRVKGYDVTYFEVPGGIHAPETWRLRLPLALAALGAAVRPR